MTMELPLDRSTTGRFRIRLPLALAIGFLLVALVPFASADSKGFVDASMQASRSQASPGDHVTFWISIDLLDENVRSLLITEIVPSGLAIASSSAPASCLPGSGTWRCETDSLGSVRLEVMVVVQPGTEGKSLLNSVHIESLGNEEDHQVANLSATLHVVPASPPPKPSLHVRVTASQDMIVPGSVVNYRIEVTNNGTAPAANVSVLVSMPTMMRLVSASPWPTLSQGALNWTIGSIPVSSRQLLFNTTLSSSDGLTQVRVAVAVIYGDGQGNEVRVEGLPSSLAVVPVGAGSLEIPIGVIVVLTAILGGGLVVAQRTIGLPLLGRAGADEIYLLHRSGLVLKHYSIHPSLKSDSDIVGGMMAAVRMFVEDSVSSTAGPLREIRFGAGNIVFVNGRNVTLAGVNAKGNQAQFALRAKRFLRQFERVNGDALSNFDGMAGRLTGVDSVAQKFGRNPRAPAAAIPPLAGDVPRQ